MKLDKDVALYVKRYCDKFNTTPEIFVNEALRVYFKFINQSRKNAIKIIEIMNENRDK